MPYETNISYDEGVGSAMAEGPTFVAPNSFRLLIDSKKYPNTEFLVQQVTLPDISVEHAPLNLPRRNIGMMGDKVNYGLLELTFLIDEEFLNYLEIHDWLLGMVTEGDEGVRKVRDMSLIILNSHNNKAREFKFVSAYPTNLSSLQFDATGTTIDYLTASVTFNYSYYKII
jgi:hypothetical protein